MIFIGIFVALIIFSLIILIHEAGHFYAARWFGVKVEEFGLGIPPRAKKLFRDKKGTLYSLNWLPIGGFVRLKGETTNKNSDDTQMLVNKPWYQQSIIILAGVIMNFILAGIIFSILFFVGVKPIGVNTILPDHSNTALIPTQDQALERGVLIQNPGVIVYPNPGSLAQQSGLRERDIIIEINNTPVQNTSELITLFQQNPGQTLILTLQTGTQIELSLPESSKMGSYIGNNITLNESFEYKFGVLRSIQMGFRESYEHSVLTLHALGSLLGKILSPETPKEREQAIAQVSGPIGMVDFISSSLSSGIKFLLIISAIISINLGVFNLLPIPALDGGRFILITLNSFVQKIIGKKALGENIENMIHLGFFIVLIILSILVAYNDILKILE